MHGDLTAVIYSVLLISLCVGAAVLILKAKPFGALTEEVARKVVHIGVCNWYFIWRFCFETDALAILGLLVAAIANTAVTVKNGNRRWGLTYYPLAIIMVISCVSFWGKGSYVSAGIAILGMGYGDGLAALCGRYFTEKKVRILSRPLPCSHGKSAAGTLAFIVSVSIIALAFGFPLYWSLLIALAGAICEAYTPYGLDNFTVPGILFIMSVLLETL